jgi:chromosome segregation ATPase
MGFSATSLISIKNTAEVSTQTAEVSKEVRSLEEKIVHLESKILAYSQAGRMYNDASPEDLEEEIGELHEACDEKEEENEVLETFRRTCRTACFGDHYADRPDKEVFDCLETLTAPDSE